MLILESSRDEKQNDFAISFVRSRVVIADECEEAHTTVFTEVWGFFFPRRFLYFTKGMRAIFEHREAGEERQEWNGFGRFCLGVYS